MTDQRSNLPAQAGYRRAVPVSLDLARLDEFIEKYLGGQPLVIANRLQMLRHLLSQRALLTVKQHLAMRKSLAKLERPKQTRDIANKLGSDLKASSSKTETTGSIAQNVKIEMWDVFRLGEQLGSAGPVCVDDSNRADVLSAVVDDVVQFARVFLIDGYALAYEERRAERGVDGPPALVDFAKRLGERGVKFLTLVAIRYQRDDEEIIGNRKVKIKRSARKKQAAALEKLRGSFQRTDGSRLPRVEAWFFTLKQFKLKTHGRFVVGTVHETLRNRAGLVLSLEKGLEQLYGPVEEDEQMNTLVRLAGNQAPHFERPRDVRELIPDSMELPFRVVLHEPTRTGAGRRSEGARKGDTSCMLESS